MPKIIKNGKKTRWMVISYFFLSYVFAQNVYFSLNNKEYLNYHLPNNNCSLIRPNHLSSSSSICCVFIWKTEKVSTIRVQLKRQHLCNTSWPLPNIESKMRYWGSQFYCYTLCNVALQIFVHVKRGSRYNVMYIWNIFGRIMS